MPEEGYERKRTVKEQVVAALLETLDDWRDSSQTFEQDVELEFGDAARIFIEEYTKKTARLLSGDFSALVDSPIAAGIVETLVFIAQELKADLKMIPKFFSSPHFKKTPAQQLSAHLYAAFKQRLRRGADQLSDLVERRERKHRGLIQDIQHASTYAPYCQAFFADTYMAALMKNKLVGLEADYSCRVFSASNS